MTDSTRVGRCLAERSCADLAARLFPGAELIALDGVELGTGAALDGPLFAALAKVAADAVVGDPAWTPVAALVVTGSWLSPAHVPAVVPVADHVNLVLRGPLTGRWPDGVPRSFPCMTGIYQPGLVRLPGEPPVYSAGVIAAGVGDVGRLSAFERRALNEGDYPVLSDRLVPAAIAAAYCHVNLAAGIVPEPP